MTTDLLDRLVVPFLEEHEFNYSAEDDTITFNFRHDGVPMHISVTDAGTETPILSIAIVDIVEFPAEQMMIAEQLANRLNLRRLGKFMVTGDRRLLYALETCARDTTGTGTFKDIFELAVLTVAREYPALMMARWSKRSVEGAMTPPEAGEGDPPYKDVEEILHEFLADARE